MAASSFGCGNGLPLVERAWRLDVKHLLQTGVIQPGQQTQGILHWPSTSKPWTIAYDADLIDFEKAFIRLCLCLLDGPSSLLQRQNICLSSTIPHYGGLRWWFVCPLSGARTRVLHLPAGARVFASRQAHGLTYYSQRQGKLDRLIDKARAARQRLDIDDVDLLNLSDCSRPKGMHWSTYCRLVEQVGSLTDLLWKSAPI